MDSDPAPIPVAKRRVAVKPTMKPTTVRSKTVKKELPKEPAALAKTRPTRAFGVSRNNNIPLEKVRLKPHKPAGAIVNPPKRNATATEKVNSTERKKQQQKVNLKKDKGEKQDEVMRTPLAVAKKVFEDGTPYLSALNCSKCRLDRLETSSYWLNQIRLSEAVGKHFVSAAFFRLALECNAQPCEKIRSELKHYTRRHQTISTISLFDDLLQSYGLAVEKPKSGSTGTLVCESKKEALFFYSHKDELEKETDAVGDIENFTSKEEHSCNSNEGLYLDICQGEPKSELKQDEIVKPDHGEVASSNPKEHGCNPKEGLYSDICRGEPKSELKQDEIVKPDHGEVAISDPIEETSGRLRQDVLKNCSNYVSEKKAVEKSDKKSPPLRGSLHSKKSSITSSEKSNSTKKAESCANLHEQSKSKGKHALKNETAQCVNKTKVEEPVKDEVEVSLVDSRAS